MVSATDHLLFPCLAGPRRNFGVRTPRPAPRGPRPVLHVVLDGLDTTINSPSKAIGAAGAPSNKSRNDSALAALRLERPDQLTVARPRQAGPIAPALARPRKSGAGGP